MMIENQIWQKSESKNWDFRKCKVNICCESSDDHIHSSYQLITSDVN